MLQNVSSVGWMYSLHTSGTMSGPSEERAYQRGNGRTIYMNISLITVARRKSSFSIAWIGMWGSVFMFHEQRLMPQCIGLAFRRRHGAASKTGIRHYLRWTSPCSGWEMGCFAVLYRLLPVFGRRHQALQLESEKYVDSFFIISRPAIKPLLQFQSFSFNV